MPGPLPIDEKVHPPVTRMAGDDWVFPGQLFAADGQPLSLTNLVLEWSLTDKGALTQIIDPKNVTIEILDAPNGEMRVRVPSEITSRLPPARYIDVLRATDQNGFSDSLWTGVINVVWSGLVALRTPYSQFAVGVLAASGGLKASATKVP